MLILTTAGITDYLVLLLPIGLVFVFFYFFMIKPEKKRQQKVATMQGAVQNGDKIITIGGIYGIIDEVSDNVITITVASGARMKLERYAIKRIMNEQ